MGGSVPARDQFGITSISALFAQSRNEGRRGPNEYWSKAVVEAYGMPVPRGRLIAADDFGGPDLDGMREPFAVKFMSSAVLHKSDSGAVRLNVSAHDLPSAMQAMVDSPLLRGLPCDGFLVEEMADIQHELVLGGINDSTFGPAVMLGFGGVLTEVLDDVVFRLCPVVPGDVRAMLRELRGYKILAGYRGAPPVDVDAVIEAVMAVAGGDGLLMAFANEIAELDINPLVLGVGGVMAVDVRVLLSRPTLKHVVEGAEQ